MGDVIYVDFQRNSDFIDPNRIQHPPTLQPEPEAKPKPSPSKSKGIKSKAKATAKMKRGQNRPRSLYARFKDAFAFWLEAYML